VGAALKHGAKLQDVGGFSDAVVDLGFGHARHFQRRGDVFKHGHMRVVHKELVHEADLAFLGGEGGDVFALHEDLTGGNRVEPRHHLNQRSFASAGFAQQHVEVAFSQREGRGFDVCHTLRDLCNIFYFQCHGCTY